MKLFDRVLRVRVGIGLDARVAAYLRDRVQALLPGRPAVRAIEPYNEEVWRVEAEDGSKVVVKQQLYGFITRGKPYDLLRVERDALGLLGVGACVVMFASPLSTLATVWRTRSTASLVPAVTVASAACSVLWALYGLLEGDAYVYGPNVAGVFCSAAQGLLFLLFGGGPQRHCAHS